jgi:hypothetical protein
VLAGGLSAALLALAGGASRSSSLSAYCWLSITSSMPGSLAAGVATAAAAAAALLLGWVEEAAAAATTTAAAVMRGTGEPGELSMRSRARASLMRCHMLACMAAPLLCCGVLVAALCLVEWFGRCICGICVIDAF